MNIAERCGLDTALFLDDRMLVQEGVTEIDGSVVDTLRGIQDGYTISDNGRFVLFEAILDDGREGAFLIDVAAACPADTDASGTVDVTDLIQVISTWGQPGGPGDVNGDGIVDVGDLVELITLWGPCPA